MVSYQEYDVVHNGVHYPVVVSRDGEKLRIQVVEPNERMNDLIHESGRLRSALNDPNKPVTKYVSGDFCLIDVPRETIRKEIRQIATNALRRFLSVERSEETSE